MLQRKVRSIEENERLIIISLRVEGHTSKPVTLKFIRSKQGALESRPAENRLEVILMGEVVSPVYLINGVSSLNSGVVV